jgi:PDDEXK-like domain of unknown function (DUF3799)
LLLSKLQTVKWKPGEPISKPGMYSGISLERYHTGSICDGPSISSSGLRKIFSESPAHYWCESPLNPDRIEPKIKRHFILGRAVHHLMLGEPFFAKLFVVQPGEYPDSKTGELKPWNNNSTHAKLWHSKALVDRKLVLLPREIEQIKGMAVALGRHPLIKPPYQALNGLIERSLFWKDKATGVWLKSRPDAIPTDGADFVDLKTCDSVLWPDLVRSIGKFGYPQQGALVRQAAREVFGIAQASFTLVFVESNPPHCVRVVELKPHELDRGDRQNRASLDLFARCLKSGHWPGPDYDKQDAEYIEMSDRQQKAIDDQLQQMEGQTHT